METNVFSHNDTHMPCTQTIKYLTDYTTRIENMHALYLIEDDPPAWRAQGNDKEYIGEAVDWIQGPFNEREEVDGCFAAPLGPAPRLYSRQYAAQDAKNGRRNHHLTIVLAQVHGVGDLELHLQGQGHCKLMNYHIGVWSNVSQNTCRRFGKKKKNHRNMKDCLTELCETLLKILDKSDLRTSHDLVQCGAIIMWSIFSKIFTKDTS